ncbi:intradiol ring-cleavage dioxygenase [Bradyrhizobium sp. 83012]|uniref:Intradiol ring-cleavage dioxygenase n=1 Tax=Bradyrhizobium aeschynomenes TaxID=2734909 RepID=A0ABX2CH40_9BRAD|nr:intradiol ring-cleavage dioxygenase [Bradyrhizobium aeschynomenes]NPU66639.1 intradiol ring-cleavage dioxygenase [Bradyrhizobium aeschynomenes]
MANPTRRGFLGLVSTGAALLAPSARATSESAPPSAGAGDACILTPQSESGPYYLDPGLVRADIAEGRPGVPLALRLRVIEAGACTPIAGARVDIWHCDARGVYSGFSGQSDTHKVDQTGKTFLRGTQMADTSGWAGFRTIYPGWYAGRATHVHFRVFVDDATVLTGQTFFPEALNEFIYTNVPDYTGRPKQRLVINANDRVATEADPDHRAHCAVKEERDHYLATLTLAVSRKPATPVEMPTGRLPPVPWIKDRLAAVVPGLKRSPF